MPSPEGREAEILGLWTAVTNKSPQWLETWCSNWDGKASHGFHSGGKEQVLESVPEWPPCDSNMLGYGHTLRNTTYKTVFSIINMAIVLCPSLTSLMQGVLFLKPAVGH